MHPKASSRADDSFTFLEQHGADLSRYDETLSLERAKRTNGMRKIFGNGAQSIVKRSTSLRSLSKIIDAGAPGIDAAAAAAAFASGDGARIAAEAERIAAAGAGALRPLARCDAFLRALVCALGAELTAPAAVAALRTADAVFAQCDAAAQELVIDEGVCLCLMGLLSSESDAVLTAALLFATTVGSSSAYGRDAVLSFGLYASLIDIAKAQRSEDVTVLACRCLRSLFATGGDVDSAILMDCAEPVIELLQIPSKRTLAEVIDCLVEMTNKMASLVYTFFDVGIAGQIIALLDDGELQGPALQLIGNMSVSQPAQIKEMLSLGLVEKLAVMAQTPHVSDVLWILSNLIESVPNLIVPLFDADFVRQLIALSGTCNSEVKREIGFLFATLVIFSPADVALRLMAPEVIEILVEMVGCGCSMVTLRCLDSIVSFIRIIALTERYELVNLLIEEDIQDRINDLMEYDDPPILERAEFINSQISNFQNKI